MEERACPPAALAEALGKISDAQRSHHFLMGVMMKRFSFISAFLLFITANFSCWGAQYPQYQWPVHTSFSIINTISTLQFYGPMPGFHHGVDLKAPAGTPVYAPVGGIVGMGYYYPRVKVPYTFGVFIEGDDGYRWEFHHVDPQSVPKEIVALAKIHGHVAPGTLLARIYDAPKLYPEILAHLHVNVIDRKGFYQNPLNFFPPLTSHHKPRIRGVYVVGQNNNVVAGWNPGMKSPVFLKPGRYKLVLDISDVLGDATEGDSLRRLSVSINGRRIGDDDFSEHLPEKSFLEGVKKVYETNPIVFPDGKTITNQTIPTRPRRFLYQFDWDVIKNQGVQNKEIHLQIYAQDFAKNAIRKKLAITILKGKP